MNNASATQRLHKNLGSAALVALEIGADLNLSICPKSQGNKATFRIIQRNGKLDFKHPAIAEILKEASLYNHHVAASGNVLEIIA